MPSGIHHQLHQRFVPKIGQNLFPGILEFIADSFQDFLNTPSEITCEIPPRVPFEFFFRFILKILLGIFQELFVEFLWEFIRDSSGNIY